MSSKEECFEKEIDLLRKTPARTGVFLLTITTEIFPTFSPCHFFSDESASKKIDTDIIEEVPHALKS